MITNRTGPVCDSAENTGMEGEFDTEDRPNPRDIVAYSHQRVLCFAAQQRRLQLMQGSNACLTWAKDKAVIPAVYIWRVVQAFSNDVSKYPDIEKMAARGSRESWGEREVQMSDKGIYLRG